MQGDVRVESSPAGGARFVLILPVLAEDDVATGHGGDEFVTRYDGERAGGAPSADGLE